MNDVLLNADEMAIKLKIASSTVRKYAGLLEDNGYTFKRSNQNAFLFRPVEVDLFQRIIDLKTQKKITLIKAVAYVTEGIVDVSDTTDTDDVSEHNMTTTAHMPDVFTAISAMQEQMNAVLQQNAEILQQNKQLIEQNKLLQEPPKVEESVEEVEPEPIQQPKKKWWQFGK